jgi:hypothetical protein
MRSPQCRSLFRNALCAGGIGLLLASCSVNTAQSTRSHRLHLEEVACKQIGTIPKLPKSGPGSFTEISVKSSLILALADSNDQTLEDVARDLKIALRSKSPSGNGTAMVRALKLGVAACGRLGLPTTS